MEYELTEWISDKKPIRVGVYELESLPFPYHYWDGAAFDMPAGNPDTVVEQVESFGISSKDPYRTNKNIQAKRWRGLAEEPK